MLPDNDRGNEAAGSRVDYLSRPYNDPIRQAMRELEAALGQMFEEQNAQQADAGGLFSAAMALVGAVGGFLILGPAGVGLGAALGGGAGIITDSVIDTRLMSTKEWNLAYRVFRGTLPARDKIVLTNVSSFAGRAFTFPGSLLAAAGVITDPVLLAWLAANPSLFAGKIVVNVGSAFGDASTYMNSAYPVAGQLLIHELTHVWQITHGSSTGFVCKGLDAQARNSLGENVYAASPGQQWNQYGLEQQANLVDTWFRLGAQENALDPYFRYISKNIRTGDPNAASSAPLLSRIGSTPGGVQKSRVALHII